MSDIHIEKGNNSFRGMEMNEARDIAQHANLPFVLAELQEDHGMSEEEAKEHVISAAHKAGLDLKIVSVGGSTGFVTSNPETNEITVSFDPCMSSQNIKFWPKEHSLGGKVFAGVQGALTEENEDGFFVDQLKDAIIEAADKLGENATLRVTGMSKGAAMSVSAVGQWMSEGFFKENPNITLKSIHSFGPSPCGNAEFAETFEAKAKEMGVDVWHITGGEADPVPTLFTDEGPWYTNPPIMDDYVHVGTQIDLQGVTGHRMDSYIEALHTPQGLDIMSFDQGTSANFPEQVPPTPTPLGL